jgi:hypothetical protein
LLALPEQHLMPLKSHLVSCGAEVLLL